MYLQVFVVDICRRNEVQRDKGGRVLTLRLDKSPEAKAKAKAKTPLRRCGRYVVSRLGTRQPR